MAFISSGRRITRIRKAWKERFAAISRAPPPIAASIRRPHRSPSRRRLRRFRIARRKKNLQLMGCQRSGRRILSRRPPGELAARQPLVAKPITLAVINEYLYRRRRSIAEYEYPAIKRIMLQHLLAQPGQTVDSAAKVGWLDGHHYPHLRRDLNHGEGFQKLRLSAARSGVGTPFRWTRIFAPAASSNSTVHSQPLLAGASSRNVAADSAPRGRGGRRR